MSRASLAFLLGVVGIQQLSALPGPPELLLLAAAAVLTAYKRYWPVLFLLLGLLWASGFAYWRLSERLPDQYQNTSVSVEGYVLSLPQQQDNRLSFDFAVRKPAGHFPDKIRLNWYHPQQPLKAGQSWRLEVKLKPAYGRLNPGGFDYETWLFANHIAASGYVRNKPAPRAACRSARHRRLFCTLAAVYLGPAGCGLTQR